MLSKGHLIFWAIDPIRDNLLLDKQRDAVNCIFCEVFCLFEARSQRYDAIDTSTSVPVLLGKGCCQIQKTPGPHQIGRQH